MKSYCIAGAVWLVLGLSCQVWAQLSPTQLKSHRARIENSRRLGRTVWSYDTIFHKGEAYGILRSVGRANRDFSVFALDNPQELILVQNLMRVRQGSIEVLFRFLDEAGGQGVVRSSIDVRDFVAQLLVDDKLLTPTGLNRAAVDHFLRKYGVESEGPARLTDEGDESADSNLEQVVRVLNQTNPSPPTASAPGQAAPAGGPPRNRNALILQFGDELQQDNVLIGRVQSMTNWDLPGHKEYTIYDPQGQLVATLHEDAKGNLVLITARDNRRHEVLKGSADYKFIDRPPIGAAKYLIRHLYL